MKKLFTFLFAFLFTLSLGLVAYAKDVKQEDMNKKDVKQEDTYKKEGATKTERMKSDQGMKEGKFVTKAGAFTYKAKDIIGAKVENREEKTLGTIEDLGIDPKTNRVAFAIIAHGGAIGIGTKDIAVPLEALSLKSDDNGKIKMFVLNMSEDRFANAPSFDKNSWPDKRSAERSYNYFGQNPYWSGKGKTDQMKSDETKKEPK